MAPLKPIEQTVFEEGPKSSVGVGAVTPFVYQETVPILPAPINPGLAVTDQQAWYKLGAEAFAVAGKLYEEVLDYQISGQEANIQALTFDLEDKLNDAAAEAEIKILSGAESQEQVAKDIQDFYNKEKETFKTKAIEILGQNSYDYYTNENSDIGLLGTKYRRLALQTRKSNYDITNTMQRTMLTLNTTLLNLRQQRSTSSEFYSGQTPPGQLPLSTSEISKNVPLDQITSGERPLQVNEKGIPVVGFDLSGREVMVDSARIPLVTKKQNGAWYINPAADVITTLYAQDVNQLRELAIQNIKVNPITSQDGTRLHPEYQKNLQLALRGNISPQNSFYYFQQLATVSPKALQNLPSEPGNSDFTSTDSALLSIIQFEINNSASPQQIQSTIDQYSVSKDDVTNAYKFFEDITFEQETGIIVNPTKLSAANTELLTISNAVVAFLSDKMRDPDFGTEYTLLDDDFKDAGGETIADLIQFNPIFKAMVTRAYIAVKNNPEISTTVGNIRNGQIAEYVRNNFLDLEFNHAGFNFIGGRLVQGNNVRLFKEQSTTEAMTNSINLGGFSEDQRNSLNEAISAKSETERMQIAAGVGLRGYFNSGIKPQKLDPQTQEVTGDSKETSYAKAMRFIRHVNPKADLTLAGIFVRNLSDTQLTRTGLTTSTDALNDSTLIRIAFAVDPSQHETILRDNPPVDFTKLTQEQQLQRSVDSFKRIPSSEYWNWGLDTTDVETMEMGYSETQPGGIPLGIISIPILDENGMPLKNNTGKAITFQPVTKDSYSSSGLYIPRYSNQVGIMQPAILTGGLNTSDFAEYFKKQSEENLGYLPAVRNSLLFPAGVSSSSEKQTTEFLRNPYFWGEITEDTLEYRVGLFKQYLESEEIPNSSITSVDDLVVLLSNNPTLLSNLSAGDFYFSDIPDPVITRAVQHYENNKGLFNRDVMQTTFEKGKSLGLKTLDQYLSLMFTVASQYSDNRQDDFGYNYREAAKDPNFDVNNPPSRKAMGSDKQGLILYRPTSGSFPHETAKLVRNGYNIYQSKTNSQEFYAFSSDEFANDVVNFDEFSPVYIIRYKADGQQQQQSLDTSIPNTQTPEKIQTVPFLPGWYGWSPNTGTSSATQPTKKTLEDTFVGPPDTTGAAEEFLSEWDTRKNKLVGINTNEQQDAMFAGMFSNKDTQKKSQYNFKTKSDLSRQWQNLKDALNNIPEDLGRQWQNFKDRMSTLLPDIKKGLDTMENWKNETPVGQLEQARIQSARDTGRLVREMLEKLKGEPLGEYNPLTGEGGIEGLMPQPQQLLKLPLVPFLLTWEYLFNNQTTPQNNELIKQLQPTIDDIKSKTLTEEELKTLGSIDSIIKNNSFPDAITSIPEDLGRQWQNLKDAITSIPENLSRQGQNLLDKTDASPGAVSGKNKPDVEQATIQITEAKFPGVWNSDGSLSNIRTISFQETKNGPHILIPTIKKGRVMTDEEAIKEYQNTKEHFGIFSTVEKATEHATELHSIEEAKNKQIEKGWMALINASEGMETKAYNKDGKWTIGKGSTTHPDGRPVKKGDVITPEQADLYARHYVYTKVIPQLRISIPTWYEMNFNQQAAIISFAYNVGEYFYNRVGFETITKALKTKNNWGLVPSALPLYNKGMDLKLGKKRVLDGLIKRRKKEAELWLQAPATISEGK